MCYDRIQEMSFLSTEYCLVSDEGFWGLGFPISVDVSASSQD